MEIKYKLIYTLTLLHFLIFSTPGTAQQYEENPTIRTLGLMPWPSHVHMEGGKFRVLHNFTISVTGNPSQRIYGSATRMLRRLDGRTGLFFTQASINPDDKSSKASMVIHVNRPGKIKIGEDETYELVITPDKVKLNAKDDIGALRGLETFLQLIKADNNGYYAPAVKIKDHPRFRWRGLLLDVSRRFMPLPVIERNIDAMAAVKMNVLHLHLSDDQGFRVQSKTFPKLTGMGSNGQFYTQLQIKEIIDYANRRGIIIIPEFDVPAHTTSWFVGYPEYASAPGPYTIEKHPAGIHDAVFDPTKKGTYTFLDSFFKEMSKLFPAPYIHIGGDENNGVQWKENKEIQQFMDEHHIKSNAALQTYFIQKLSKIITKYGKRIIGWDEILQPGIPKNAIIQSWRGKESLYMAARQGHEAILSKGYYINWNRSAAYYYKNDPIPPDSNLTKSERNRVLGGEAAMWTSHKSPQTVDSKIWPTTAAVAERLWSPDSVQNTNRMYRRLRVTNLHFEELGITAIKNQSMMLRRLAGSYNIQPLRTFVNVLKPLKRHKSHSDKKGRVYKTYSPLTLIADAAHVDPKPARSFNKLVDAYVQNPKGELETKINEWLSLWIKNNFELQKIIDRSPVLNPIKSVAESLNQASLVGLQALNFYSQNYTPGKSWIKQAKLTVKQAKQSSGGVRLLVTPGIVKLINLVVDKTVIQPEDQYKL